MYSEHQSIQIIVKLLKLYDITHIVISPGSRHAGLVSSLENDKFFECFSVVDERSAAFFALGLIQELRKPVVVCCTSGTAACNYLSATTEAYYRKLPLVILTADRHPYFFNQQEDQMIDQSYIFSNVCKKSVSLPIVKNELDFWYCSRLVNEALLELNHHGAGPVHINYPVESFGKPTVKELPSVTKISRYTNNEEDIKILVNKLNSARILVLYGHNLPPTNNELESIREFVGLFDCVLAIEKESNISKEVGIETFNSNFILRFDEFKDFCPDIVITMYGCKFTYPIRSRIKAYRKSIKHWHVSEQGLVEDPFMCLDTLVESTPMDFFKNCNTYSRLNKKSDHTYLKKWMNMLREFKMPDLPYSDVLVVKNLIDIIPPDSILHVGNGHISNLIQLGDLKDDIHVYRNEATTGIDGVMSTFIGQASLSEKKSYLLIGDLSFFYDMNALVIPYIKDNVRIFVNNNGCGETMYNAMEQKGLTFTGMDSYIGAKHDKSVRGWAIDRGFEYISADNQDNFIRQISIFIKEDSNKPILFEVFTDRETNYEAWKSIEIVNRKEIVTFSPIVPGLRYAIYGAGDFGKLASEKIDLHKGYLAYFCDSNKKRWNTEYLHKQVLSPAELVKRRNEYDKVIIGTKEKREVLAILHALGFEDEHIILSV